MIHAVNNIINKKYPQSTMAQKNPLITSNAFTKDGKQRSLYTLKVVFTSANIKEGQKGHFWYRSDDNLVKLQQQGKMFNNELEALLYTFTKLRSKEKLLTAELFNNSIAKGGELIMEFSMNRIIVNRLPPAYSNQI